MLSQTVANALPEAEHVTKQFVQTFDKFFDILNVRSPHEGIRKRKPNLAPYRDVNDPRLQVSLLLKNSQVTQIGIIIVTLQKLYTMGL